MRSICSGIPCDGSSSERSGVLRIGLNLQSLHRPARNYFGAKNIRPTNAGLLYTPLHNTREGTPRLCRMQSDPKADRHLAMVVHYFRLPPHSGAVAAIAVFKPWAPKMIASKK